MNEIAVYPDPPQAGNNLTIFYHWETPVPGEGVTLNVEFEPSGGSVQIALVCPSYGDYASATVQVPGGDDPAKYVTITDETEGADPLSRLVV